MSSINQPRHIFVIVMICITAANSLYAQDSTERNHRWRFLLEPYIIFPNMNGTAGLGGLPNAPVDENAGDIFRNLQFGGMLYAEAKKGFWTFSSDLTYMHLKSEAGIGDAFGTGTVDIKQLAWEVASMRQLAPWFELGLAFQLNNIKSDVDLFINTSSGIEERTSRINETWIDPSVLVRVKTDISKNKKWFFQFRGNIGGGGIGSDLYWQLQSYFGYRFSKLFQLSAGYRVIYIDYETGSGNDRFVYNMTTFGPVIRFGFNLGKF